MPAEGRDELARAPVPDAHRVVPRRARGPAAVRAERDMRDLALVPREAGERLELPATLRRRLRGVPGCGPRGEERPEEEGVVIGAGYQEFAGRGHECVVPRECERLCCGSA